MKALAGHYGELLASPKGLDILFSPMIGSVPSFLRGHVVDSLSCPRVMAAPESARAGFVRERDLFAEHGIRYVSPYVALADEAVVPRQLFEALKEVLPGLTLDETRAAVRAGYEALADIDCRLRTRSREILEACARDDSPCLLVLARPYHMDSGIGHEIDADLQARGYPVLWCQYLPTDADLLGWLFDDELRSGDLRSPLDIADVWPSSYSANTNEILWAAKVAARLPWVTCVIRLSSYECGMDQPTYSPVQQIVEQSGTLFFSFQDLDATRPSGSVRIRIETIAYYLERHSPAILRSKRARLAGTCPMGAHPKDAHV